MDKPAAKAETPKLGEMPKLNLPKMDFDALVALQKANLETLLAAQRIVLDLAQTVAKRQAELVKELMGKAEVAMKGGFDSKKQPAAYVDDAKAAMEKAVADAKETIDLGLKAQNEVVDLLVKRASANFEQVKQLAA
jgi:phasin family protein